MTSKGPEESEALGDAGEGDTPRARHRQRLVNLAGLKEEIEAMEHRQRVRCVQVRCATLTQH